MNLLPFVLLSFSLASLTAAAPPKKGPKKNQPSVIQLISDGFGPASETFARSFLQGRDSLPFTAQLPLDKHLVGTIRTRSTDSLVTDSAASATAYSCGLKSVNAYIGVDSDKKPCGTVLEGAKAKGYKIALVTTSRVTHATPASYSAHIDDRDAEDEIASQQLGNYLLGRQADLIMGCGIRHFLPNATKPGIRTDGRDLIAEAKEDGWTVLTTKADFDGTNNGTQLTFPTLALWEASPSHCAYELDRKPEEEPSLTEMALAALNALNKEDEPFFIMIEGARIDHAGHNNDAVGHVHDILEYNKMFEAVTQWMDQQGSDMSESPEYVLISTSDHECGGLTLATGEDYLWYPDVLINATHTTEYLAAQFATFNETDPAPSEEAKRAYLFDEVIKKGLGISDVTDSEIDAVVASTEDELALTIYLGTLLNTRAHLGWSTVGHSGVDVNLYYHESPSRNKKHIEDRKREFAGNHENTFVGTWTEKYLNLDLASITHKLNNDSDYSWYSNWGDKLSTFTDNLEHYHGGLASAGPARRSDVEGRKYGYSNRENVEIQKRMAERSHSKAKRVEL